MIESVTSLINSPGFGVLLGAAISILTTFLANQYASKDKRRQRSLEITYALEIRQLNLLVDLEKALQKYGRLHIQCQMSLLNDGIYAKNGNRLVRPEIDEDCRLAGVEVVVLNSQIQAEAIRKKVDEALAPDSWSNEEPEIESFMHESIDRLNSALEVIGDGIRDIQGSLSEVFDPSKRCTQ